MDCAGCLSGERKKGAKKAPNGADIKKAIKIVLQTPLKSVTIWLQKKTTRNKLDEEEARDMHKYFLCLMLCLTMFCSLSTLALAAEETVDDTGMAETVNTVEAEPSAEVEASEPEAAAEPAEPVEEPAAAETVEAAEAAEVQTVEPEITGPYFLVDGTAYADPAMTVCNGVYYVSLTNAVRALRPDAVITWEGEYAVVSADGLTIRVRVGDQYLEANGRYLYIYNRVLTGNDQVLVPARIIAQAMGAWVEWHQDTGELEFHAGSGAIASGDTFYDSDSVYWLSRIINVESGNQPLDGKLAVGTVIMNRVESPLFPDTIYDVIFAPNQFTPAQNGTIHREPNAESVIAAKLILEGIRVGGNSLYFVNPSISPNSWAQRNRTYVTTIGAHSFFS